MKKLFYLIVLFSLLSLNTMAQCGMKVSFTYTEGTNGDVAFTSNITGGVAPYTYAWNFGGNGNVSTDANPTFTYPANYNYGIFVNVRDANGCTDSIYKYVDVTTAQPITCPGEANFTVSTNGGLTDFTFSPSRYERTINFGDGTLQYVYTNLIEHAYKTNGSYTATSTADTLIDGFYITVNCSSFSQNIAVSNVQCHADFIVSADTTSSQTGYFSLVNTSTDYTSLRWYINGNAIITWNDTSFGTDTYPPGTYNICLAMAGPNGCADSICKTAILNYTPTCSGLSFDYTALSSPCDAYQFTTTNSGSALTSIEWDTDNSIASIQENPIITLDFSSSQNNVISRTINVKAAGGGCSASQSFTFNNPADFSVYDGDSTSSTHVWHVYPVVADIASQTWDFGDGSTSNDPYPTHTYASAGIYNLCHQVTLTNGCSYNYCYSQRFYRQEQGNAVVQIVVESPTAVKSVNELAKVNFYPNPVSGNFYVKMEQPLTNAYLIIFNTISQPVKTVPVSTGGKLFSSNIKQLSAGIYYYQIVEKGVSIYRGKFIVSK